MWIACVHPTCETSKDLDQQTWPWPWIVAGLVGAFRKGGGWVQASRISSAAGIPLSRDEDVAVLAENPSPPSSPSFVF